MKIKINEQYEIDSQDITKLTFKLTRISEKNTRAGIAFFFSLKDIKPFLSRNYPDLVIDKINELAEVNSEFIKMIQSNGINGKHDVKFYIDDFYFLEFDKDTYVLYTHPDLNGHPGNKSDTKPAPNKERRKVVCFPQSINNAIEYYYNCMLKNSELEGDEFIKYIHELTNTLKNKLDEIKQIIKSNQPIPEQVSP